MADLYRVQGMTCQGCVRAVTNAVQRAVPGTTVTADLAAGTIAVEGPATPEAVRQAVEAAGFAFAGAPLRSTT